MATVQEAPRAWPTLGLPELRSGDLVYVLGFDFAEVVSFSCCINKMGSRRRRGGCNSDRVHIRYADGTVFHARRCELHLLEPHPDCGKSLTSAACSICEQYSAVISFMRDSHVCSGCWIHWYKAESCPSALARSSSHLWDLLSTTSLHVRDAAFNAIATKLHVDIPRQEISASLRRHFSQIDQLRSAVPQPDFASTARPGKCGICKDFGAVLNFSCSHSACLECWVTWANAQVESFLYRSHPSTVRCWGETCGVEVSNAFWDFLPRILISPLTQRWPMGELRALLNRRRLQANVLLPQMMQVDCCRPNCIGLGYLGSDTVQCFICEHQWIAPDNHMIEDVADDNMNGAKRCPKCSVWISKDGGCDHMTCIMCRHEFWWSTLLPYP